jgi:predicted GNAT family acetyltransferase
MMGQGTNLLQNELKKAAEFNYKVIPSISYET